MQDADLDRTHIGGLSLHERKLTREGERPRHGAELQQTASFHDECSPCRCVCLSNDDCSHRSARVMPMRVECPDRLGLRVVRGRFYCCVVMLWGGVLVHIGGCVHRCGAGALCFCLLRDPVIVSVYWHCLSPGRLSLSSHMCQPCLPAIDRDVRSVPNSSSLQ